MKALLILGGAALAALGWLWLWLRSARIHWFWVLGGAFPPLALLSGLYHWRQALLPVLVLLAGLGALGTGLWQLGQTQPQQLERLLHGQWGEPLLSANTDSLQGQLQGQAFVPGPVTFRQGVLTLRQGQDFIASKEVRLDLSAHGPALLGERFALDILPTDGGLLPMVEVLWQDAQTGQPQARRISRGYTLRLQLQRQAGGLQGQLYLSLPSRLATMVSGTFQVTPADEQPDPAWSRTVTEQAIQPQEILAEAETAAQTTHFSLELLLASPRDYLHRTLLVETAAGRQVRGSFQGINEDGELLIRQTVKAPGFVLFQVLPVEIVQISLEN